MPSATHYINSCPHPPILWLKFTIFHDRITHSSECDRGQGGKGRLSRIWMVTALAMMGSHQQKGFYKVLVKIF
ncbi:hypothetical protein [Roseofilum sp. Guam]|uniref:hypothetical protein n=1 Tax=Roseofilum sp. Guam TaxID=2821502 RepID=UPI001B06ACCF|nr:hypothetical protein [Roseofilum sp. Guam]MBP0028541.1 hypothetical protein [Roseofilum sp. Guam]